MTRSGQGGLRGHLLPPRARGSAPVRVGVLVAALAAACGGGGRGGGEGEGDTAPPFVDVTAEVGVAFVHDNGATARRFLPETMGAGVAVFDADGDEAPDLFFVDGMPIARLAEAAPRDGWAGRLYRNRGDGTFEDRTEESGLRGAFVGMGVVTGDVDNDGDADLVLTGVGGERLFLNDGAGRFAEVTAGWGLASSGFSTGAALVDVDRDGWLDLAVGRYVEWSPETDRACRPDGENRIYCTPEAYPGADNRLYRNVAREGGRGFEDVTAAAGFSAPGSKTLGIAVVDLGDDLWPDLAVANDTTRNLLFRNLGDGTFEEIGVESGMALGSSGAPRGAMGIDAADVDGDGMVDLAIGNFSQEMASLYLQSEGLLFRDDAASVGVGLPTLMDLAFGTLLRDLDCDGRPDLVFANGHIEPDIARFQPAHAYAQPLRVFRNVVAGSGAVGFEPLEAAGGVLGRPLVGRGLAAGDLDGDGDLDLVVTQNGAEALVLRNDWCRGVSAGAGGTVGLRLRGAAGNRSGYGTRAEVEVDGAIQRVWHVSGGSYLSSSSEVLRFGVGSATGPFTVTLTWPSGTEQRVGDLLPGVVRTVEETPSDETGGAADR